MPVFKTRHFTKICRDANIWRSKEKIINESTKVIIYRILDAYPMSISVPTNATGERGEGVFQVSALNPSNTFLNRHLSQSQPYILVI